MDGKYADTLCLWENIFKELKNTKDQIFHNLITTFGLRPNERSIGLMDSVVTMDDLCVEGEGK